MSMRMAFAQDSRAVLARTTGSSSAGEGPDAAVRWVCTTLHPSMDVMFAGDSVKLKPKPKTRPVYV